MIKKIVITGGPCAGKTTALSWIDQIFSDKGYRVIFVPEASTLLKMNGITPWNFKDYQRYQMKTHFNLEETAMMAAQEFKDEKVLIVCDRGVLDDKAYFKTEKEYQDMLADFGRNETQLRDSYDAVFHLITAADGAESYYTLENNKIRDESVPQAIATDNRTINAWIGHPYLKIVDNRGNFEEKLRHLINEISIFLNENTLHNYQRKFLIDYPNIKYLESLDYCQRVEILQTYIGEEDNFIRLRRRGINRHYVYFETRFNNGIINERRITSREYKDILFNVKHKKVIRKTRYCLREKSQYFNVDVFPFYKDKAIISIDLDHEYDKIIFPEFVNIQKEITHDPEYANYNLAKEVEQ